MLARKLADYERREIESALAMHAWNVPATAHYLRVSRRTLYRRMAKYGLCDNSGNPVNVSSLANDKPDPATQ